MTNIEWTDRVCRVCWACRASKTMDAFGSDRSRPDGKNRVCRECKNRIARERHICVAVPNTRRGFRIQRRDGDKKQARSRVNHDVREGLRPNPNDLPCTDCGHLGPERRHEYDHHLGYAAANHGDVQAVCSRCHHARERARRGA
jgi:hypothetical protein